MFSMQYYNSFGVSTVLSEHGVKIDDISCYACTHLNPKIESIKPFSIFDPHFLLHINTFLHSDFEKMEAVAIKLERGQEKPRLSC